MSKDSALPGSGLSISYSTAVPVEPKEYKGKNHPLLKKQRNLLEPNSDTEYEDDEKLDEEQTMRKHGQSPQATDVMIHRHLGKAVPTGWSLVGLPRFMLVRWLLRFSF